MCPEIGAPVERTESTPAVSDAQAKAVKADKPVKSVKAAKPAKAVKADKPVKSVKAAKAEVKADKPVKSVKAAKAEVKADKPVKSVKAAKAEVKAEKAKKDGLRKSQVKILQCLANAGKAMTRAQIAEKGGVDTAGCVEWIGSHDPDVRAANDAKHFPSLLSLGLVKFGPQDDVGGRTVPTYEISAEGKTAAAKL
jgi:outer membrane biosynthesis protein TonB